MELKPKHQSLSAAIMLLISVAAGLGYTVYCFQSVSYGESIGPMPVFSQVSAPTVQEMQIMGKLKPKFKDLAIPSESIPGPVALDIFGYRRSMFSPNETSGVLDEAPEQFNYALTFTFSSGSRRFCIIDDVFYPKGAILPDGAKIVQIEAYKVLIRKKERQLWIPMEVPLNPLKDQTISPQSSKKSDMEG